MQPFLGSSTVFTCKCTYPQFLFLTMPIPIPVIRDWELSAVVDDFEIGDELPNCRKCWQRVSLANAKKMTIVMYVPPSTMMLDFELFVMRYGRFFKYHIDPSFVGQPIQKWLPVNPGQDTLIARTRSPRHFVYDINADATKVYIKVAYGLSGGTAAVLTYRKEQVVYASEVYCDLKDKLINENILTGITRITIRKHDGSLLRGRQVLHRSRFYLKSKRCYFPVRRIGKKVDPRQHSLKHCFKLCA